MFRLRRNTQSRRRLSLYIPANYLLSTVFHAAMHVGTLPFSPPTSHEKILTAEEKRIERDNGAADK